MKAPSLQKQQISFLKKSLLGSLYLFTWFCCAITIWALCMTSIFKQFCFFYSWRSELPTYKSSDNAPKVVLLVVPQSLEPVMARSLCKLFPEWFLFQNDIFTCTVHICTWLIMIAYLLFGETLTWYTLWRGVDRGINLHTCFYIYTYKYAYVCILLPRLDHCMNMVLILKGLQTSLTNKTIRYETHQRATWQQPLFQGALFVYLRFIMIHFWDLWNSVSLRTDP